MTITYARESVIDFTKPFMNLGISILFKVPTPSPPRLFSFMNPFDVDIWIYIIGAYVLVSLTIFMVAKFSPNERSASNRNAKFTLANSFWFPIGTLMQQGSDLNPRVTI